MKVANTENNEMNSSATGCFTEQVLIKVEPMVDNDLNQIFTEESEQSCSDDRFRKWNGKIEPEMSDVDTLNEDFWRIDGRDSQNENWNISDVFAKTELNEEALSYTENTLHFEDTTCLKNEADVVTSTKQISEPSKRASNKTCKNPLKCDICEKIFSKRRNLYEHMYIHSDKSPFECGVCGKAFKQRKGRRIHQLTHTLDRPFACATCGKTFLQKVHFKLHCMSHSEEKPFKCDICEKSFAYKNSLRVHMFTHQGEKPFKCNQCGKRFTQSNHLQRHLVSHSGMREFECYICSKRFAQKPSMKNHILGHIGEERFKCDICEKGFVHKRNFKKHMLNHSRKK